MPSSSPIQIHIPAPPSPVPSALKHCRDLDWQKVIFAQHWRCPGSTSWAAFPQGQARTMHRGSKEAQDPRSTSWDKPWLQSDRISSYQTGRLLLASAIALRFSRLKASHVSGSTQRTFTWALAVASSWEWFQPGDIQVPGLVGGHDGANCLGIRQTRWGKLCFATEEKAL